MHVGIQHLGWYTLLSLFVYGDLCACSSNYSHMFWNGLWYDTFKPESVNWFCICTPTPTVSMKLALANVSFWWNLSASRKWLKEEERMGELLLSSRCCLSFSFLMSSFYDHLIFLQRFEKRTPFQTAAMDNIGASESTPSTCSLHSPIKSTWSPLCIDKTPTGQSVGKDLNLGESDLFA